MLAIGIPIVLLFGVFAYVVTSGNATTQASSAARNPANLIRDDSPTLGAASAGVTMVEFLDPECEACKAAYPSVKRILAEYDGRVKLVVRYMPLHNNSKLAAQATEAAGEQGKYWEMQQILFERQSEWGEKTTPQTDLFAQYATSLGLNRDQFLASLQNPAYAEKIERDRQDGVALGVRGTPTIFINGTQVRDFSYAGLKSAVDTALRQ